MSPRIQIIEVSIAELRRMFNEARYDERSRNGELYVKVLSEGKPSPSAKQPPGTKSQLIGYFDAKGHEVARAHQYLLKNGSLGASGKPDPKKVFQYPTLYVAH
jgi:hypothetical protein